MVLKTITQSITTAAIHTQKKNLLVVNTTSIPYILHALKHVELSEKAVYTELELC
jgi:hypothetical protein